MNKFKFELFKRNHTFHRMQIPKHNPDFNSGKGLGPIRFVVDVKEFCKVYKLCRKFWRYYF